MPAVVERLERLRSEFEAGDRKLRVLDETRSDLRDRLLRISGAIRMLEELIAEEEPHLKPVDVAAEA